MKKIALVIFASLLLFSCKKKKDEEVTTSTTDSGSGYYIKGKINGTLVETADGIGGYTIVDANAYGGISYSYSCSFQKLTSSGEKYFQISFNSVDTDDDNDSDELLAFFATGKDTLNDGGSPYYSLYYTDNDRQYQVKYDEADIEIFIDEITDLGKQTIGTSTPRVVKLKGRIPTGRLYEYDWDTFGYTGEYVDVTDLEFEIRIVSSYDM